MQDNIIVDAFIDEAKAIVNSENFGGMPDGAMFWAHTRAHYYPYLNERNNSLCWLFQETAERGKAAYKLDTTPAIEKIGSFLDRYAGDYPPEICAHAWDVFSDAFARAASGDHVFIAANDMRQGDFFERVELPILQGRFSQVTTLEPSLDDNGFKQTLWPFADWHEAQQAQWHNHHHYLDGSPYPDALLPSTP